MGVRKALRWSPWAPSSSWMASKRKYAVTIRVIELVGSVSASSSVNDGEVVAVRIIRWRGPSASGYLRKKRKGVVGTTGEKPVSFTGVIEFDKANEFQDVCCFRRGLDDPLESWQVSFSVLHGFVGERQKEKKLEEIGVTSVNLAEWIQISETQREQNGGLDGKESQHQRKKVSIPLSKDDYATDAILYVDVSFVETSSPEDTSEVRVNRMVREESKRNEETTCTFEPDMEFDKLLQLAGDEEKVFECKNRTRATSSSSSSEASSPDLLQLRSVSKRMFLSWGRRGKSGSKINSETENQSYSNSVFKKEESSKDADPIGNWECRELISRDGQTKLKAQTFFASIDQRDESAGGESACTALVAVIANALHSRGATIPNRSEFDVLIREGSLQWRNLCNDASYIVRFPNKHFDLDTVLEANIRPISVLHDKSYVGFFQPESFESLRGAMSFDDIWNEVTCDLGTGERVYVVSWNDHFFVLKVEAKAYYIVDTLGERLYEGCSRAYILRFDESTQMYRLPAEGKDGEEMVCSGKECCREFIKRFLAAIPLREEMEVEEKGMGNANAALHHRLQIEFHFTETLATV